MAFPEIEHARLSAQGLGTPDLVETVIHQVEIVDCFGSHHKIKALRREVKCQHKSCPNGNCTNVHVRGKAEKSKFLTLKKDLEEKWAWNSKGRGILRTQNLLSLRDHGEGLPSPLLGGPGACSPGNFEKWDAQICIFHYFGV